MREGATTLTQIDVTAHGCDLFFYNGIIGIDLIQAALLLGILYIQLFNFALELAEFNNRLFELCNFLLIVPQGFCDGIEITNLSEFLIQLGFEGLIDFFLIGFLYFQLRDFCFHALSLRSGRIKRVFGIF